MEKASFLLSFIPPRRRVLYQSKRVTYGKARNEPYSRH